MINIPLHHHISYGVHVPVFHSHPHGVLSDSSKFLKELGGICALQWKLAALLIKSVALVVVIQVIISSRPSPGCTNVNFSPYTSQAFNVSGIHCEKFTIKKYWDNSPTSQWNTSLYLLHQMPKLMTIYNFNVSKNISLSSNEFYKWSFYLQNGSSYTVKSCELIGGSKIQMCIVGGDKNLSDWIRTRSCTTFLSCNPLTLCNSSESTDTTCSGVVMKSETYHFVYSTQSKRKAMVQVDMTFAALEYSINRSENLNDLTCTISNQSCSVHIPRNFNGVAVVMTAAPFDTQPTVWTETLPVSWECTTSLTSYEIHLFIPACVSISMLIVCILSFYVIILCRARCCNVNFKDHWRMFVILLTFYLLL